MGPVTRGVTRCGGSEAARVQAYGVMLAEDRQYGLARQQFKAAAAADENHLPVWQAWAVMELRAKQYERARQLFQRGVWAAPKDPNLVWLWQARPRTPTPRAHVYERSATCATAAACRLMQVPERCDLRCACAGRMQRMPRGPRRARPCVPQR